MTYGNRSDRNVPFAGIMEAAGIGTRARFQSGSSGDDVLVFLRELEHSRTQRVSLFDGEHSSAILAPPS
jgi:hypothetical protein